LRCSHSCDPNGDTSRRDMEARDWRRDGRRQKDRQGMIWSTFGRRWAALPTAAAAGALLKSYFDTLYAGAGSAVPSTRSVATQHSLTGGGDLSADRTLNLVNDTAAPGNSKVYGTDGSGTRGWFDAPTPDYGAGNAALAYGGVGTYVFG